MPSSVSSVHEIFSSVGLSGLSGSDYVLLGIIAFSALISIIRGFVREAISLGAWIVAFWVALTFGHWLAGHLVHWIHPPMVRTVVAILILLVGTLLLGMLVAHCADSLIRKGKLSGLDRLLGLVFGVFRGVLIIALLLFLGKMLTLNQAGWWKSSRYIPFFAPVVTGLEATVPAQVKQVYSLIVPAPLGKVRGVVMQKTPSETPA